VKFGVTYNTGAYGVAARTSGFFPRPPRKSAPVQRRPRSAAGWRGDG